LKSYRVHGKGKDKYDNVRIGINSRLDTIQAAILLEKLAEFPTEVNSRNIVARKYIESLQNIIKCPTVPKGLTSSWAQYTLISDERETLVQELKLQGVPTAIYYATCMHNQTAFSDYSSIDSTFPIAEKLSSQVFSIPMHPYLNDIQINDILSKIHSVYEK
jgi:dTDP-4-amino-4,6-dideoxygalactose transaminase